MHVISIKAYVFVSFAALYMLQRNDMHVLYVASIGGGRVPLTTNDIANHFGVVVRLRLSLLAICYIDIDIHSVLYIQHNYFLFVLSFIFIFMIIINIISIHKYSSRDFFPYIFFSFFWFKYILFYCVVLATIRKFHIHKCTTYKLFNSKGKPKKQTDIQKNTESWQTYIFFSFILVVAR